MKRVKGLSWNVCTLLYRHVSAQEMVRAQSSLGMYDVVFVLTGEGALAVCLGLL